jgi:outer membrane murein-binding lipoprotein Lpp
MRLTVAALVTVTGLAGCANLDPTERELHEMRDQLSQVSNEVGQMKSSLDKATEATREATRKSEAAQSTAKQALSLAKSDQASLERANERLERLDHAKVTHHAKKGEDEDRKSGSASDPQHY